jgi:hypothetical protein
LHLEGWATYFAADESTSIEVFEMRQMSGTVMERFELSSYTFAPFSICGVVLPSELLLQRTSSVSLSFSNSHAYKPPWGTSRRLMQHEQAHTQTLQQGRTCFCARVTNRAPIALFDRSMHRKAACSVMSDGTAPVATLRMVEGGMPVYSLRKRKRSLRTEQPGSSVTSAICNHGCTRSLCTLLSPVGR